MVPVNGSGEPSIPPASPSQCHKGQCTRSVAVHPIRRGAMPTDRVHRPNQQEQTRYRQVNRCHHPSKLHEGRRRVELNREISRRANPLLFGRCRAGTLLIQAAAPVGGGKAWPGFEIDHSEPKARVWRSRGRAAAHGYTKQPGPARPASPAPGKQPGRTATSTATSTTTGAQTTGLRPRSDPSARSPDTLTAWRPRS